MGTMCASGWLISFAWALKPKLPVKSSNALFVYLSFYSIFLGGKKSGKLSSVNVLGTNSRYQNGAEINDYSCHAGTAMRILRITYA